MPAPRPQLSRSDPEWHTFVPSSPTEAAQWLLAERRLAYLLNFTLLKLGRPASRHDAEEVLQEFLHKSLGKICSHFDPARRSFWTYFLKALQYACFRHQEKLKTKASTESRLQDGPEPPDPSPAASPSSQLQVSELRRQLERAGADLDKRAWEAVRLRHFENHGIEEIARRLQVTGSNAKLLLHRGLHELAKLIRWDACSPLRPGDVHDWPKFCQLLTDNSAFGEFSVAAVLWDALDAGSQSEIHRFTGAEVVITPQEIATTTVALNHVLRQSGLWSRRMRTHLRPRVAEEATTLLRRRRLGPIATLRLNRLIVEYGFPGLVIVSNPGSITL